MSAATARALVRSVGYAPRSWEQVSVAAPQLAITMQTYLAELGRSLSPGTVGAADTTLRQLAGWLIVVDPTCTTVAAIRADHVDAYRPWLFRYAHPTSGRPVSASTVQQRMGTLRLFFERIAAWGYPDAPSHLPFPANTRGSRALTPTPHLGWRRQPAEPTPPRAPSHGPVAEIPWTEVACLVPQMAATMASYLEQLAVSSRPATVEAASLALRLFAAHVTRTDPSCVSVSTIERRHIESYKVALVARPGRGGTKPIATETIRNNLGQLRTFFERVIDWDYADAPRRVPVFAGDLPKANEPTPKFLDDPTAAKFMIALATDPDRRRRLMVELLARTGMRVGELAALRDDAMYKLGDVYWLRVPLGKLHNDRTVPLHPMLVGLINDYRAWRGPSTTGLLVERDDHQPYDRRTIHRYVAAAARRAGVGHVHPHQLRHTLATQCINRGMSLEAIAALLGHRSPRMTLVYARISDTNVADQYFKATEAVETEAVTTSGISNETRDATQLHRRLLGNGHCTRPVELDCRFQTICEGCGFYETGPEFLTVLRRQRDDAAGHADTARTKIYDELIRVIDQGQSGSPAS